MKQDEKHTTKPRTKPGDSRRLVIEGKRQYTTGEAVRILRQKLGMTLEAVAAKVSGYDAGNLSRFERDQQDIPHQKLNEVAAALGITGLQLKLFEMYGEEVNERFSIRDLETGIASRPKVPVISWVQAGAFNDANDPHEPGDGNKWVEAPTRHGPHTFALEVRGDSMTNPSGNRPTFPDGSIIIVDPDVQAENRSFVIAKFPEDDEATFKQLIKEAAGTILLAPLNPRYPTIPVDKEMIICGVVIGKSFEEI